MSTKKFIKEVFGAVLADSSLLDSVACLYQKAVSERLSGEEMLKLARAAERAANNLEDVCFALNKLEHELAYMENSKRRQQRGE